MFFATGEVPTNAAHPGRKALHTGDHTKVVQSARDEADINVIVKRMMRTGQLTVNARVPTAGDFSEQVTDYHTAMNMVRNAQDEFMKLPARVRSRFSNDPQYLMNFLADPQNNEESYNLGLRVKPAGVVSSDASSPAVTPVVAAPAAP